MPDQKRILHEESRAGSLMWLAVSLGVGLLARLALWLSYAPVRYSDTASYWRLAESVPNGFDHYDGTRTPGYPAFLALVGTDQNAWLVQMVLGLLTGLLLFYLGWRLSGKGWFGGLLALAHTANLGQLMFEANLLTETLTTFFLAVLLVGVYHLLSDRIRPGWGLAAITGLSASLALLTRPLFIFLPAWVGLFIAWRFSTCPAPRTQAEEAGSETFEGDEAAITAENGGTSWKARVMQLGVFSLPVLLLVGGWVLFIHHRFGDWGLTTMTGYHLVQHTGDYFEYVPDEYAALRDTYIQYRDEKIAATGTQTNAIWDAIPELSRVSGMDFYELSRKLAQISVRLILEHPGRFLENVAEGWWMFWRAPVYWDAEALHNQALADAITRVVAIQRMLLVAINALFVIGSLAWACACYLPAHLVERMPGLFHRLRTACWLANGSARIACINQRFMLFLASTIWVTSILQSLLDHGDNPRFLLPLQSFVVVWVAWLMVIQLGKQNLIIQTQR